MPWSCLKKKEEKKKKKTRQVKVRGYSKEFERRKKNVEKEKQTHKETQHDPRTAPVALPWHFKTAVCHTSNTAASLTKRLHFLYNHNQKRTESSLSFGNIAVTSKPSCSTRSTTDNCTCVTSVIQENQRIEINHQETVDRTLRGSWNAYEFTFSVRNDITETQNHKTGRRALIQKKKKSFPSLKVLLQKPSYSKAHLITQLFNSDIIQHWYAVIYKRWDIPLSLKILLYIQKITI